MMHMGEKEKEKQGENSQKKPSRSASTRMRRRSKVSMAVLMIMCIAVAGKLFKVSVMDNAKYETLANNYHFGTMTLDASRGAIYDANGTALAWSATVYNVYIDPKLYQEEMDSIEKSNAKKQAAAEEDGEEAANLVDTDQLHDSIVTFLSEKLEITPQKVEESFAKSGRYYVLQTQVEKDIADEIVAYFDTLNLSFIGTEATTRRYYPQNELAAAVIGFTNGDGDGQYGLEYQYDEYLAGVDGRVISAQAANGEEMPYRYSTTYEAEDGASLYLTLDTTMQYYLEKALSEMVQEYEVQDRATGILMNPKTGEIYAMATYPSFDLNNPSEIYDTKTANALAELPEAEYQDAYLEARETQWRNKAISEINPPGSTFKIVTTASAFEEDLIDLDSDSFFCQGYLQVQDAKIGCSKRTGHGAQTFTQALTNSCNPAFMEIGLRLGVDKFSYYFHGFGLSEKTGIDLPGEVSGAYVEKDDMSQVDLASSAFGQTNELTTLELITAYSAAINGGYLVTPYVVDHIVDSNGNMALQNSRKVKRQIISEETSQTVREQLQAVVDNNPSHNAYIQGYRIGGKSGTAEIRNTAIEDDYVASYCCFAPADDPEVILLIQADYPNPEIGYYGSRVVTPYAREVMQEILPYMGYYPEYTDEEAQEMNVNVPLLQDASLESAKASLEQLGLTYEIVGEGSTVVSQSPTTGTSIAKGGKVLLYTESDITRDLVTVPNLVGMTISQANETLSYYGLNYAVVGASASSEGALVQFQSEAEGTQVQRGTSITLTLVAGEVND
ncbi:penicillin-binding transpeptidase domain-containing protein [uncultured Ruminococcus sp.]|uniref:penicillin-binding transpeptidase domain-containing protein n=1 Tax=uncultured Ruminococcus sp. TaxID=165186 RepID=UPI002615ADC2|nr:penicillin-binding transpeptidase domain-containing protein [uncultured Ruminococcus sp.]